MTTNHVIIGVHVTDRLEKAAPVQALLTEYGCNIKTRLGLHETSDCCCSKNGILLLEMFGEQKTCMALAEKLGKIEGLEVQTMVFTHPA